MTQPLPDRGPLELRDSSDRGPCEPREPRGPNLTVVKLLMLNMLKYTDVTGADLSINLRTLRRMLPPHVTSAQTRQRLIKLARG